MYILYNNDWLFFHSISNMKYYRGIIFVDPHGTYIITGKKTLVVKSKSFKSILDKNLLLIENKKALGIIQLTNFRETTRKSLSSLRKYHKITNDEIHTWWPNKHKFYLYDVVIIKKYKYPRLIEYGKGPQVFIKPENIKILL